METGPDLKTHQNIPCACFDLSELFGNKKKLGELGRKEHKLIASTCFWLVMPRQIDSEEGEESDINTIVSPTMSPYPTRFNQNYSEETW